MKFSTLESRTGAEDFSALSLSIRRFDVMVCVYLSHHSSGIFLFCLRIFSRSQFLFSFATLSPSLFSSSDLTVNEFLKAFSSELYLLVSVSMNEFVMRLEINLLAFTCFTHLAP